MLHPSPNSPQQLMPSLEQQSRAHKETICTLSDIFVCILCHVGPSPDSLDTDNHREEG